MGYYAAALWINKTHIHADYSRLTVRNGPLPWFGNKTIETPDIKQLYIAKRVRHAKGGSTIIRYDLRTKLRSGADIKLVSGLEEVEQATFLEEQLERHLGIKNKPVPEEIPEDE